MVQKPFNGKQIAAMERTARIGLRIQQDHPEVADLYRNGIPQSQIVRDKGFETEYGVNRRVARLALQNAIAGYRGSRDVEAYGGLIQSAEELREICRRQRVANAEKTTGRVREQVAAAYDRGEVLETRVGHVYWSPAELIRMIALSEHPSYKRGTLVSNVKVARTLNDEFHRGKVVRDANAVSQGRIHYQRLVAGERL